MSLCHCVTCLCLRVFVSVSDSVYLLVRVCLYALVSLWPCACMCEGVFVSLCVSVYVSVSRSVCLCLCLCLYV